MYLAGYTLDNLSLMALTVATGFVVDDAIVVLENVIRHMEMGQSEQPCRRHSTERARSALPWSHEPAGGGGSFVPILFMGGIIKAVVSRVRGGCRRGDFAVHAGLADHHAHDVRGLLRKRAAEAAAAPGAWARRAAHLGAAGSAAPAASLAWRPAPPAPGAAGAGGRGGLNVHLYRSITRASCPMPGHGPHHGFHTRRPGHVLPAVEQRLQVFWPSCRKTRRWNMSPAFTGGGQRRPACSWTLKPGQRQTSSDQVIAACATSCATSPARACS